MEFVALLSAFCTFCVSRLGIREASLQVLHFFVARLKLAITLAVSCFCC